MHCPLVLGQLDSVQYIAKVGRHKQRIFRRTGLSGFCNILENRQITPQTLTILSLSARLLGTRPCQHGSGPRKHFLLRDNSCLRLVLVCWKCECSVLLIGLRFVFFWGGWSPREVFLLTQPGQMGGWKDGDMSRMLGVRPNFSFLLCCCKRT